MRQDDYDVVVIGGGPGGLAAAVSARQYGVSRVLIIERDRELGGILRQCIHNGFGLHRFQEELTGPSYASRFIRMVQEDPAIEIMLDAMVLKLNADRSVVAISPSTGLRLYKAKAVVLAMGCRERTRGAIRIPGARPAGIFTAGAAQRMVNMEGFLPGQRIVILGSGDIGLIMARRMVLERAQVRGVVELLPYSNGLTRNVVQCLEDYDIPLHLGHTVIAIHGQERITGVSCARVDDQLRPIPGSEFFIDCDCLLLSVGLIPENELSRSAGLRIDAATGGPEVDQFRQTSEPGIFAAGNVVHVHDLVDYVSDEGDIAGKHAALYAIGGLAGGGKPVVVHPAGGVRSVVPQRILLGEKTEDTLRLYLRAAAPMRTVLAMVRCGDRTVLKRPLPIAKPGEMITLDLSSQALAEITADVNISLQQGGQKE